MARKRMVTRTITATTLTLLVADLDNEETTKEVLTLSGTFKTPALALKAAKKRMDSEHQSVLKVISMNEITDCVGMSEEEFLANAHHIDR